MIVEFCGVPGGGKSTLARVFTQQYPDVELVTLDTLRRLPELWHSLRFTLKHPLIMLRLFRLASHSSMPGLFWYSLHLTLRACAKYQKASLVTGRITLVDEGLVHLLCTLPARPLSAQTIKELLRSLMLADVVCVAETGNFHRFHREGGATHPRAAQGEEQLRVWEQAVKVNTATVARELRAKGAYVWSIPERDASLNVLQALHNYLAHA